LFFRTSLRNIIVPRTVAVIESSCFYGCLLLTSIDFEPGSRLQSVEAEAFHTSALRSFAVPSSVEVLGMCCFYNCAELEEVVFGRGSRLASIERQTFCFCATMRGIVIPASVRRIGRAAFAGSRQLVIAEFEEGSRLETVEEEAFSLTALPIIDLPDTVESVGQRAFPFACHIVDVERFQWGRSGLVMSMIFDLRPNRPSTVGACPQMLLI
jgi:hypothetical protein